MRSGELPGSGWLKPSVPYIEIAGAYNASIVSGWNDLVWNLIYYMTSDFVIRTDGTILVYTTGMYKIDYEISVTSTTAAIILLRILKNGTEIESSRSKGWCVATKSLQLNVSRTSYLKAGDLVSFQLNTTANNTVISDEPNNDIYYSRTRISYLPFGGWDNNSGGNVVFRGIRR